MSEWITSTMESLGLWGVAALMLLENVVPPIPSEVIMPLAGFSAARGEMSLWAVVVAGSVGSVLGQFPLYWLGHRVGEERLHRWADRHGKWLTVSGADIDRASAWLRRRGPAAVFFCRMIPGVRSLISIPAGVSGMSLWRFTLFSAAGIAIWSAGLAWAGHALGANYERVTSLVGPIGTWVWVAVGVGLLSWIAWRLRGCWMHSKVRCPLRDGGADSDGAQASSL